MNRRNVTGIPNPKEWKRSVDCPVTVRDVSPVEDETIPMGRKDALGIVGDDRPASLSVKKGDDKLDDSLPRMQVAMGIPNTKVR